jgi:hypothetical protein
LEKEKKEYQAPEKGPEPAPSITPDMVQRTFKVLDTKGMLYYSEGGVYVPTEKGWKLLMKVGYEKEEIVAYGHPDITATHASEIEITKSRNVNSAVIGVKADKSSEDFSLDFKKALKDSKKVEITIDADGIEDIITAFGSPALKLADKESSAITKTDNVDNKTVAIMADKAAFELNRELIEKLRDPNTKVKITLEIKG